MLMAPIIVAIILAYLAKVGGRSQFPKVWLGIGAAVALSAVLGLLLFVTVGGLQEPYEQLFEAATMALAAGVVVTWLVINSGSNSAGLLEGSWLSWGVIAFFVWLGIRQFRKMEKSFADLI